MRKGQDRISAEDIVNKKISELSNEEQNQIEEIFNQIQIKVESSQDSIGENSKEEEPQTSNVKNNWWEKKFGAK